MTWYDLCEKIQDALDDAELEDVEINYIDITSDVPANEIEISIKDNKMKICG